MAAAVRPKGLRLLGLALRSRKAGSMLAFGFSSGLPFALLIGTLTAWLGEAKINLATIGLLSWIGLASAFKFLWSPAVDRLRPPVIGRLGRRKGWIVLCQAAIVAALLGLVATDPATAIGRFALFAFLGAVASATQDIAIDAWRIDVADGAVPVEVLSAIYQLGFRTASIVGGAFALHLAATMSWPAVYTIMAALMGAALVVALAAPDTPTPPDAAAVEVGDVDRRTRGIALAIVGVSWLWAIGTIAFFMVTSLAGTNNPGGAVTTAAAPWVSGHAVGLDFAIGWRSLIGGGYLLSTKPLAASDFIKYYGAFIVAATVLVPLAVAATLNRRRSHGRSLVGQAPGHASVAATDHLYRALIAPLGELTGRLGWGVLGVMALILSYQLCFNIWASFAYPFYLDYMHYTKDEVAFASKVFGIVMSMTGVALGGVLFLRIGRFPTVLIGAVLPIFGNFLYADLADGAVHIDAVLRALRLDRLAAWAGSDVRMARLLLAIAYENISTGIAGAAFVAYVSGIVSKKFPAVQYALLSSLTFLIGSLGRGVAGEMFDRFGYAPVFRWTAAAGLFAIAFVLVEWWRSARMVPVEERGGTGAAA